MQKSQQRLKCDRHNMTCQKSKSIKLLKVVKMTKKKIICKIRSVFGVSENKLKEKENKIDEVNRILDKYE